MQRRPRVTKPMFGRLNVYVRDENDTSICSAMHRYGRSEGWLVGTYHRDGAVPGGGSESVSRDGTGSPFLLSTENMAGSSSDKA